MSAKYLPLALFIIVVLLASGLGCQAPTASISLTETPAPSSGMLASPPVTTPASTAANIPTPTPKPSLPSKPASFVLGSLTITPASVMEGEDVTCSIQVSNTGGSEGSCTVVFNYKSSTGSSGSKNVEVTLQPGQTKAAAFAINNNLPGTYFVTVNDKSSQYSVTPRPIPIRGVPSTSASAITSPPPSMVGINTHTEMYGQDADPAMITLGPKLSFNPEKPGYPTKHSMAWELKIYGTPVLAPIDMVLVGFQNNSAYRVTDGQNIRMDDLVLFFESASPDWPGMIIYVYHLSSSPLLLGQAINPDCSACEEGQRENIQAQGHLYMGNMDYVTDKGNAGACQALIGYTVKRGELIGFAGTMPAPGGPHSFVDIGFKVSDTSVNPLFGLNSKGIDPSIAQTGNPYLHWVQPSSFFYWKSFSPDADFPSGVLAYPFECDGFQLPTEQHDVNFKYTAKK